MHRNGKGMIRPCKTDKKAKQVLNHFAYIWEGISLYVAVSKRDNSESWRFGGKRRDEYSQKTFQMLSLHNI